MKTQTKAIDNNENKLVGSLREIITHDYVSPFTSHLKKSRLNETSIIREMFCCFQKAYHDLICFPIEHHSVIINSLQGLSGRFRIFENLSQEFSIALNDSEFKRLFLRLGLLYLDIKTQVKILPPHNCIIIQTMIRELFYNYLDPLPELRIKSVNTKNIMQQSSDNEQKNIAALILQPVGIQSIIYSYMDYQSIFSFQQSNKTNYFKHKSFYEKLENVFYVLGETIDTINFSRPPTIKKILGSLVNKNLQEVLLFNSLYHALEYARYLHSKKEDGFIPSLWIVVYPGSPTHLKFSTETITIHNKNIANTFYYTHCDMSVNYTLVPKKSILPLLGTVVSPGTDFASYRLFDIVDFQTSKQEVEKIGQYKCVMI